MNIRTEKISVHITVPKKVIDEYDGAYFYHKGVDMEDVVQEGKGENCLNATFEGFEILTEYEQTKLLEESPAEPSVTAKLHYYIDLKM